MRLGMERLKKLALEQINDVRVTEGVPGSDALASGEAAEGGALNGCHGGGWSHLRGRQALGRAWRARVRAGS